MYLGIEFGIRSGGELSLVILAPSVFCHRHFSLEKSYFLFRAPLRSTLFIALHQPLKNPLGGPCRFRLARVCHAGGVLGSLVREDLVIQKLRLFAAFGHVFRCCTLGVLYERTLCS